MTRRQASADLGGTTSPAVPAGATVLVPVGSTEQHGPHLPLETDTVIATAVARGLAEHLGGETYLAAALPYGASGEHQSFPGTVSIGTDVLTQVLVELTRSLTTWAARVVLVNGHGGNLDALHAATSRLRAEGHDVCWVPCAVPEADAHAGRTETSLMLHLAPWSVRRDLAAPGNTAPLADLLGPMRESGVLAVSPTGVLGDPTGATAEEGAHLLDAMIRTAHTRLPVPA
ncbi:mycofactocin biosynthesis peptidyl-dipeptidase MftE [Nocardioides sp.]|uniref:mycofactocin biosynthesis peptidyl-dipeptidase MftE n=1 Tax=Nocardioides sp. TaxID=35761 RepID=UPI00321ABD22